MAEGTQAKEPAPSSVPVGVDPNRASIARVYDAALGGKENYAIDRSVMAEIRKVAPEVRDMAWANRNFLIRVVRYLTENAGITQFIDCGSGLPTEENTHEVAQRANPEAKVVYVDNDPVVLAHGNALLTGNEHTFIADADIYKPDEVFAHPFVRDNLDFDRPMALLQISTIHHYLGDDYEELMRDYIDRLPSGSYVAVSHFLDPQDPAAPELTTLARRMEDIFVRSPMGSGVFRTSEQILAMIPGLEVLKPAPDLEADVELCDNWWPEGPRFEPLNNVQRCIACVVGRKP